MPLLRYSSTTPCCSLILSIIDQYIAISITQTSACLFFSATTGEEQTVLGEVNTDEIETSCYVLLSQLPEMTDAFVELGQVTPVCVLFQPIVPPSPLQTRRFNVKPTKTIRPTKMNKRAMVRKYIDTLLDVLQKAVETD